MGEIDYVPKEHQCHTCKKSPYDCECRDNDENDFNQVDYEG